MALKLSNIAAILALCAVPAAAQVSATYAPTTLEPGVATVVTISLSDDDGIGLGIGGLFFEFVAPDGLTTSDFTWLNGLDSADYLSATELPNGAQTALSAAPSSAVRIPATGSLDVATLVVTADQSAAGSTLSLLVFGQETTLVNVADEDFSELDISSGRTVAFAVTGDGTGDSGGGAPGGGGGSPGGDGSTGGGSDGGDGTTDPGNDVVNDPGNGGDTGQPGDGGSGGTDGGTTQPPGDGSADGGSGGDGADGGGGGDTGGSDGQDGTQPPGDSGNGDNGSAPTTRAPMCGIGIITPALFTLAFLSGMKLQRRRW
jgi:hypothetical protein